MPIIDSSSYQGPSYLINGHFETIVPSLFRKIKELTYEREKIHTPDDDFLNLDWSKVGSDKLLIISHGLEGDSYRHYAMGLAKLFNQHHVDVLAWNNRSCGGEMNLQPILYHHGASYDLDTVIEHTRNTENYKEIYLCGISMGGAQTLKYLGEKGKHIPSEIVKAAVYSTPCNLPSSAATLKYPSNSFYKNRFLGKLKDIDTFDTHFTAKLHGFKNAEDFYQSVSADNWMQDIHIPTLIINALNDPLLGQACYPIELARKKKEIILEMPKRGGHTGFTLKGDEFTWAEYRFLEFLLA